MYYAVFAEFKSASIVFYLLLKMSIIFMLINPIAWKHP